MGKQNSANTVNPANLLLSLATAPVLVALVGGRTVTHLILEISRASEEVFRGDRLPILDPPNSTDARKSLESLNQNNS